MKFKVFLAFVLLFGAAKAFTINCDYEMTSITVIGQVYSCRTTNIPTSSGNRVTAVTGLHLSGRTNNDVEFIWIEANWTLPFVPQGFSYFFPNIRAIRIWNSAFETLRGDEFNEFPQLEWLLIFQSNLTTISSRLFEKTPKMSFINFSFNSIQRVGYDLFTRFNVTLLHWVDFSGNPCINKNAGNPAAINELIKELRVSCKYEN